MKRNSPLSVEEVHPSSVILILDKNGVIGELILKAAQQDFRAFFVTDNAPKEPNLHVLFSKFPKDFLQLPDYKFLHIFVMYEGQRQVEEGMGAILEKAERDGATVVLCEYKNNRSLVLEEQVLASSSGRVAVLGDVFGPAVTRRLSNPVNDVLFLAASLGRIEILGSGTSVVFPVFAEDAVAKIIRLAVGKKVKQIPQYIFPSHATTLLTLARILKKHEPLLGIDFSKKSSEDLDFGETVGGGESVLPEHYPFEEHLVKTYRFLLKTEQKRESHKTSREINRFNFHWPFLITFVLVSIFLPIIFTLVGILYGGFELYRAKANLENNRLQAARDSAKRASLVIGISSQSLSFVRLETSMLPIGGWLSPLTDTVAIGKGVSEAMLLFVSATEELTRVFNGASHAPASDFSKGANNLKDAMVLLQKVKFQNPELFATLTRSSVLNDFLSGETQAMFLGVIDSMSSVLGFSKQQRYLILFQNNMELRPSGGFIGSYGIANVNKGRTTDFSIHDVYDADGQLKGHIEPPFALRRHLPSAHWYLRDSNFDLDFPRVASTAAFFLREETGVVVDGVVGVDVSFVKNILRAIGPVYVSEYNETVTPENLFMLTQAHAEKGFFPGSTQKKDFLRSLFLAIEGRLSQDRKISYGKLLEEVVAGIKEKHFMVAFANESLQRPFTVSGLSSSIAKGEEREGLNDFVGVNEANIGINKANFFISKTILESLTIDKDGSVAASLTVTWQNDSPGNVWPVGDYRSYVRTLLPLGSKLLSFSEDGKELPIVAAVIDPLIYEKRGFVPPAGVEIEEVKDYGKTIYGFVLSVPAKAKKTVILTYVLPKADQASFSFVYNLGLLKQPGTEEDPFYLIVSYPETMKIVKSQGHEFKKLSEKKGKTVFATTTRTDRQLRVIFSQK